MKFDNEARDEYFATEAYNFVSGDSPRVIDIKTAIGRTITAGEILCRSSTGGAIKIELSSDGINYGNIFKIKDEEIFYISTRQRRHRIASIRLTHLGTDTGYRIITT